MEVLVLQHSTKLALVYADLLDLSDVLIHALSHLFLELNHLTVVLAPALVHQTLIIINLTPDLILHQHKRRPLLPYLLHFLIYLLHLKRHLVMVLHRILNIQRHPLL